jgi:hypothetical protein
MTLEAVTTLARAALRYAQENLAGRVEFPRDRLGTVLVADDGTRFEVYRETALRPAAETTGDGVLLEFGLDLSEPAASEGLRLVLGRPAANVATPCFAGLPGFRRKLWLAETEGTAFLELYEWEREADADRFVRVMQRLLGAVGLADAATFEVVDAASVDEYVASHAQGWEGSGRARGGRRARQALVVLGLLAVGALGLGVALGKCRRAD